MKQEKKILYGSDEAAKKVTLTGWLSAAGHFYGENEQIARYDGCTHKICECGNEHSKGYTCCDACRAKNKADRYEKLEFAEWDGTTPIYCDNHDKYFFDEDELQDWMECDGIEPDSLQLIICVPTLIKPIHYDDYYCDDLPEDQSLEDIAPEIALAFDELNKKIREYKKPLSWYPGKKRTTIKIQEQQAKGSDNE